MEKFICNKNGVILNPLVLWKYDAGHYPEAEISIGKIGEKWDGRFNWCTLRGGAMSPLSSGRYTNEENAINAAIDEAKRQLDYIKSMCRNEAEFNKLHDSLKRFIVNRSQLSLF